MAVTAKQNTAIKCVEQGRKLLFPVKTGETIYSGTVAVVGKDGYLYNMDSAAKPEARLFVIPTEDLTATANGSISSTNEGGTNCVNAFVSGVFKMTFTSITQANVGKTMYVSDNYTIDEAQSTTGAPIGTLVQYLSATSGYLDLNKFYNADGTIVIRGAMTAAGDGTVGAVFQLLNPFGCTCLIEDLVLDVTTAPTDTAGGVDIGVAANATTTSDTLIDGLVLAAANVYYISKNGGTNGRNYVKWTSTQYINAQSVVGSHLDLAAMVGTYLLKVRIYE